MTPEETKRVLSALAADVHATSSEDIGHLLRFTMRGELGAAQLGALLMGLRHRGTRGDDLAEVVLAMREMALPFACSSEAPLIDTCGTGGDGSGTFSISTGTALLLASMGLHVTKHGNRAMSSRFGSADVLEALGFRVDAGPGDCAQLLLATRFCFLFAPTWHPAMKHAGPVRRELGFRTIFNLAGPLANPARPACQVVGVAQASDVAPLAEALRRLGTQRFLVVHGDDGLDEISPITRSTGIVGTPSGNAPFSFDPASVSVKGEAADLLADSATGSADVIKRAFTGWHSLASETLALNAGAALWISAHAADMADGVAQARMHLASGAASAWLERAVARQDSVGFSAT